MEPLVFNPSRPFTLGVEIEFELLDVNSLDLTPKAPALLEQVPPELKKDIKPEFIQSMVEVSTPVCQNMVEVEHNLSRLCNLVEGMAKKLGCILYAASLHPTGLVKDRHVSPGVRYGEILNDLQLAGRRLMTQALHVHVGLTDKKTAIKVCDSIRSYLPILLALTTSSPFFEGVDSGFYSYRTNLFKTLPRSGIPETLGSWQKFNDLILLLNEATILNGIKELWWDVRPHPDFGTVEIRICDLPSRFDEILAVAALLQSLVATLAKDDPDPLSHREVVLNNKWHASRYGLDGTFISFEHGKHVNFREAATALLEMVSSTAKDLGAAKYLEPIRRIIAHGTSAHTQRNLYAKTGDFKAMIFELRQGFWR